MRANISRGMPRPKIQAQGRRRAVAREVIVDTGSPRSVAGAGGVRVRLRRHDREGAGAALPVAWPQASSPCGADAGRRGLLAGPESEQALRAPLGAVFARNG